MSNTQEQGCLSETCNLPLDPDANELQCNTSDSQQQKEDCDVPRQKYFSCLVHKEVGKKTPPPNKKKNKKRKKQKQRSYYVLARRNGCKMESDLMVQDEIGFMIMALKSRF